VYVVQSQLDSTVPPTDSVRKMLRIFMRRRVIESVNRGRRVSADGVPEVDLVAELEAEEEEELAQMDASLAEPDRTCVVGPDGVCIFRNAQLCKQ
jgi:hypothetical protein